MKKIKVLFVPAGSGMAVAGIKCLLKEQSIEVIAADSKELAPGLHLAHRGYILPPFGKDFWIKLKHITRTEKISVVFPSLDTILEEFSLMKNDFALLGTEVIISPIETIRVTLDKWEMYKVLLNREEVFLPKTVKKINDFWEEFPVIIKPRRGSGSKGVFLANSKEELVFFYNYIQDPIIQEYLPGKEYTVDCLADKNGDLKVVIPRERIETKAGISVKGKYVKNDLIQRQVKKISEILKFYGPFVIQFKEDREGIPKITEINARIAGGMSYSCWGGINLYYMAVLISLNKDIDNYDLNLEKLNYYFSRYFEEIIVTKQMINDLIDKRYD